MNDIIETFWTYDYRSKTKHPRELIQSREINAGAEYVEFKKNKYGQ